MKYIKYNKKQFLIISVLCHFSAITQAMVKNSPKISIKKFNELKSYAYSFLKEHRNIISCEQNESGFVRISVPLLGNLYPEHPGIKKIRFNYWPQDSKSKIISESIHTHPKYFESLIINGSYIHKVYIPENKEAKEYNLYKIIKNNNAIEKKSFIFVSPVNLKVLKNEVVKTNNIISVERDFIHRVLKAEPDTLSLNAVFEEEDNYNINQYNLYLTKNSSLNNIKTERKLILGYQAQCIIDKIIYFCKA